MVIPISVQDHTPPGYPFTYWISPQGATVSIHAVNTSMFPLLIRIIAIVPVGAEQKITEIKRVLFPTEQFGFTGRAVEFKAGGDNDDSTLPDTNPSKGTVEIVAISA